MCMFPSSISNQGCLHQTETLVISCLEMMSRELDLLPLVSHFHQTAYSKGLGVCSPGCTIYALFGLELRRIYIKNCDALCVVLVCLLVCLLA